MAGTPPPISQVTQSVVWDRQGREVVCFTAGEWTLVLGDGSIEHRKTNETLALEDGSAWAPAMAFAQNPVHAACCDICRDPPFGFLRRERRSHGLVRLERAKTCVCGACTCPRHRQRCSDRRYRCPRCYRKWRFRQLLLGIFFTRG